MRFYPARKKKKRSIIHSAPVSATRPHTVRSGSSRFAGRKMHSRGKKKKKENRFSPSSFSPPYGFRLPCSSVGLSCRRLQHRLSRQAGAAAHFKDSDRPPGPDSRIKTTEAQWWWGKNGKKTSGGASRTAHVDSGSKRSLCSFSEFSKRATFNHVFPIFPPLAL